MAGRKVVWTLTAEIEFQKILDYYTVRNGNNKFSKWLLNQIRKTTHLILDNNFIGRQIDNEGSRVITIGNYRIYYKVLSNELKILLIWDSRRNPEDLKKLL